MSKLQMDVVNDLKAQFHKRVEFLRESMQIIIPMTEEDRQLMQQGIDMLVSFDEELQDSESLRELSDLVDLDELTKKWPASSEMIQKMASMSSYLHYPAKTNGGK